MAKRLTKRQWRLVIDHEGMLEICAKQVVGKLPASVEVDDLAGAGKIALIGAARRFDPKQGVQFATYARHRVKGAMLDAYRNGNYRFELHDQLYDDSTEEHEQADEGKPTVVAIDPRPGPDRQAESAWLQPLLKDALGCLTSQERYALLANADGIPLIQIGARYKRSITWAWMLLDSARKKMQRELAMHRLDGA